jgi:predicted PurR-regulated permease PerM
MTVARPTIFWITVSAIALLALVLLRPILLPFAVGMALAYLLVPAVDRLERAGINRSLAALTLVLLLVVGIIGPVLVMLPALVEELRRFLEDFPRAIARVQAIIADTSQPRLHEISGGELHIEESATRAAQTMGSAWLEDFILSAWSGGAALFSLLSLLVVVPIVTIYLLLDWSRMVATIDGWLPAGHRDDAQALAHEIHEMVAGYVRGQVVVCLILAAFYATALKLVGLNHAILIGITAGLISFVPYFGATAGLVVATCIAIAQFWPDWTMPLVVAGIFVLGEGVADHVLSPRIIGSRVNLHPLWLMFALFAFGYLFGVIGLLIAIPLAASLGAILRFAMRHLLDSPDHGIAPATSALGVAAPRPLALGCGEPGQSAEKTPVPEHVEVAGGRAGEQLGAWRDAATQAERRDS